MAPDWLGQIAAMVLVTALALWLANVPPGDGDE